MRIHAEWSSPAFLGQPAAPLVGPFCGRAFLETWWRRRGGGEPVLVESGGGLLPLYRDGGTFRFLGEADLTDYHAPLGRSVTELAAAFVSGCEPGARFSFDSLPQEAADLLEEGMAAAGVVPQRREHEIAAIVDLPGSHDEYLQSLGAKQRHEVRRKRRRFTQTHGEARLVRDPGGFDTFVAMHRTAPGPKGEFMTEEMAGFFADLLVLPGTVLDILVGGDGDPLAAAFAFEDDHAYYLYNSSFDAAAAASSPGAVLVDVLIARAIATGRRRFDFLKGDEAYKFRLGAQQRPLFSLEAVR
jgi:CelD/BcsL family acetyltransferase involved in cellulose biosynthesis